jgi:hypothetical protein
VFTFLAGRSGTTLVDRGERMSRRLMRIATFFVRVEMSLAKPPPSRGAAPGAVGREDHERRGIAGWLVIGAPSTGCLVSNVTKKAAYEP